MGVWVGICGGIFIRIYPRLLGRPAVCLQGFNGNHSTFLRSRRLRHPWMETRAVQRFSRTASDGFQKRETFLVISLSLLLNFQAVWTAFCCVDTCSLMDGTQQHANPLLTHRTPSQTAFAVCARQLLAERCSAFRDPRFRSNGGSRRQC